MDHNSGPGNSGRGFDVGSGAETAGTGYGTRGGNFETSGMDHNSGPENTGGGFDVGSGCGVLGCIGMRRTGGGNFETCGMDHNSGPGYTGGGFDMGSGAGSVDTSAGVGTNTTFSCDEYGAGTGTSSNDYGTDATSDLNHGGKPTMKDRIKGFYLAIFVWESLVSFVPSQVAPRNLWDR
jgi:hypothetical protein